LSTQALAELIELIESGSLTRTAAKTVFERMARAGGRPADLVQELGLAVAADDTELEAIVRRAIEQNPKPAADYRAGKEAALNALFGPVMRETKGRYPADRVRALLQRALNSP
jgi:aspartyl-tRNA(Asn)/glutamyl-tRNA(Gln) amidotransferase subunit B